jgi:SAM-dependent methyltransferase
MTETLISPEPVAQLLARLASDRSLPTPPPALRFCGDGDFAQIGAEFLGHFIAQGDLGVSERVLEIGCGVGRMAVPLTQYLQTGGSYDGVDVVASGIGWCRRTITPNYPMFKFHHLNLAHSLYNPGGSEATETVRLPFADAAFDFICLVSVITHLGRAEVARYAAEIARLLAPGGRCFITAFLMNKPALAALQTGQGSLGFDPTAAGPLWYAYPEAPMAAVAFDEDTLLELFLRVGLYRRRQAIYGNWSGRTSHVFQDLCVFEAENMR